MINSLKVIKSKPTVNTLRQLLLSIDLRLKSSMDLSTAKRFCQESSNGEVVKVGTHDGIFHCDEVLACYLLKLLPQYKNANIIRTRDENILKDCDIVVDVGGVYDPSTHRYDHHQRSFGQTLSSLLPNKQSTIKLSSAGLIFAHFGHQIIANLLNWDKNDDKTDVVFDKVYENFVQEIDAIDNGIDI